MKYVAYTVALIGCAPPILIIWLYIALDGPITTVVASAGITALVLYASVLAWLAYRLPVLLVKENHPVQAALSNALFIDYFKKRRGEKAPKPKPIKNPFIAKHD